MTARGPGRLLALAWAGATAVAVAAAGGSAGRAGAEVAAAPFATKLPLVVITTTSPIPDDPKVTARMRLVRHRAVRLNALGDRGRDYDGWIGIEVRGHTSAHFPKRSYAIETRDAAGKGKDVSLAGMPRENDWILYASYNDKTLMRNVLASWTARRLGRYASRTAYVELFLNGRYQGVYVLMEKIKLDPRRVRVDRRGVSGGYLLEGTVGARLKRSDDFFRGAVTGKPFLYSDPGRKALSAARARWIRDYVGAFERALYGETFRDPVVGYRRYLDVPSAVDYFLVNELFHNQDALQTSMFVSKSARRGLRLGPIWDFDVSAGNSNYLPSANPVKWMLDRRPWAVRLYADPAFANALLARWRALRAGGLVRQLVRQVDRTALYLRAAQRRNFGRWPILGKYVWPNPVDPDTGRWRRTYAAEVAYLRSWLLTRARWMDASLEQLAGRAAGTP